jgi:hypothetical protein
MFFKIEEEIFFKLNLFPVHKLLIKLQDLIDTNIADIINQYTCFEFILKGFRYVKNKMFY